MELSRGNSYQTGQRRVSAAFREDKVPCPDQTCFYIWTTPATQRRQRRSSPFTQPRAVWKHEPQWLIGHRGLAGAHGGSARGELPLGPTPSRHRSRDGYGPTTGSEIHQYRYTSNTPGATIVITSVDIGPRGVETPTSLADCWLGGDQRTNALRQLPLVPTSSSRCTRGG